MPVKQVKQQKLSLTDMHADPQKMSAFMDWPWEGETRVERVWPFGGWSERTTKVSAEEVFLQRWKQYIERIAKPSRKQTMVQFKNECLKEGLGLRGPCSTASVTERIKKAIELRPDLYSPPDEEK